MAKAAKPTKRVKTNEVQGYAFGVPVTGKPNSFPKWHETPGTFIAGQEEIDEVDLVATEMERKWGCDRLRLMVPKELREKFDRQRYKLNHEIWHGTLEGVKTEAQRMVKAWRALDAAATADGRNQASPEVWETTLSNGTVAVITWDWTDAALFEAQRNGRKAEVYTLSEIGRMIEAFPGVMRAKTLFPGTEVTAVRGPDRDPMRAIPDSVSPIDDVLPWDDRRDWK
jgi:hypothetical protein